MYENVSEWWIEKFHRYKHKINQIKAFKNKFCKSKADVRVVTNKMWETKLYLCYY